MRRAVFVFSLVTAAAAAAWGADRSPEWVEERIRQWQPTAAEKRWETIGWAQDIRSAVRLGREHNRPVFLFTLDGRMGVGRC